MNNTKTDSSSALVISVAGLYFCTTERKAYKKKNLISHNPPNEYLMTLDTMNYRW